MHSNIDAAPKADSVKAAFVGGNVDIGGESWFVSERVDASVAGVEGSLPVAIIPGEGVVCVDVMGKGMKMSIESGDNDIQVSRSKVVRGSKFKWD